MARIKSVVFGASPASYDSGSIPRVAMNANNVVVEVHKGSGNRLFWRVGLVRGVDLLWLPTSAGYGPYTSGDHPAVALNGDIVIVMSDAGDRLQHGIGTVRRAVAGSPNAFVEFATLAPNPFPNPPASTQPSVAVTASGIVIEVHKQSDGIYSRRALQSGEELTFGSDLRRIDSTGSSPFVAINNTGQAVAVYEAGSKLRYAIGTFTATDTAVGSAISWGAPVDYDSGTRPSIGLTDDGYVFAMHSSGSDLYQRTGILRNGAIEWQDILAAGNAARKFDTGSESQIATNGKVAVQVHRDESSFSSSLFANACLVFDRANWMGDHRAQLESKSLRQIALPASHDSGATDGDSAQTQDLTIAGQLAYGIRYFDIRPNYDGDKSDNPIDLDKMTTYHDVYAPIPFHRYFNGVPLKTVISDVKNFVADHAELVILKLSHFRNFDQHVYDALRALISGQLEDVLFAPPDHALPGPPESNRRYANFSLGSAALLPAEGQSHGVVLILVDVDTNNGNADYVTNRGLGFYTYRDWYAPDPENADFTVFDVYSDTNTFNTMALDTSHDLHHAAVPGEADLPRGQIPKYVRFDGKCLGTETTRSPIQCDLFLMSWTIAPNSASNFNTAFTLSHEPNRNLVGYMARPETIGPNPQNLAMNLLYTDAVELSRSVDIAMVRNGLL